MDKLLEQKRELKNSLSKNIEEQKILESKLEELEKQLEKNKAYVIYYSCISKYYNDCDNFYIDKICKSFDNALYYFNKKVDEVKNFHRAKVCGYDTEDEGDYYFKLTNDDVRIFVELKEAYIID